MGGSDPVNQTVKALRAAAAVNLAITVVIGSGFSHELQLNKFVAEYKGPAVIDIQKNVHNMSQLMEETDLAVSGGGSTCWEMAYLGLPNLVLALAENQIPVAEALEKKGASLNLGWYGETDERKIIKRLSELIPDREKREAMSRAGKKLIDGKGVDRVADKIFDTWKKRCLQKS
jgi:spore coat polysaccharide biosynthesis predicted glycosyltransferase SpsG